MAFFSKPHSASAAVKIVNPNTQDEFIRPQSRKDSVQRQCRNILIYGSCKFKDKGCAYYHPQTQVTSQPLPRSDSPITGTLTAQAVNAPVFVPKHVTSVPSSSPPESASKPSIATPAPEYQPEQVNDSYDPYVYGGGMMESVTDQMQELDFYDHDSQHQTLYSSEYNPDAMDAFYSATQPTFLRQPLNYHLYTNPIPIGFVPSTTDTHFVPSSTALRELLQSRSETIRTIPAPGLNLTDELQGYHTLVPLENVGVGVEKRKFGSWYSTVYKAINSSDGGAYVLRRIENYRLMHQAAFSVIETWSHILHPNIVSIREAFTTRAFNDNSLVVAYAYYANSQTLFDVHFKSKANTFATQHHGRSHIQSHHQTVIPERTIWSYIVQLASAIKKVHDAGQAVRMIDLTKVLVTGRNRVRISSCGIVDILLYETPQDMAGLQQEDLNMLGRLVLALCSNNPAATSSSPSIQKSLEVMGRSYSQDIKTAVVFLIGKNGHHKTIGQFFDMIGSRVVAELDDAQNATDRLEGELYSELENARLVRLLCKFNFINERPEFARDQRWSETGDRYIIKLFRDYVFHQVDESGNPVINLAHVLTCLNKLDAGTEERIMLVARDEQSCLVVSYKEVKSCIESAFGDLARVSSSR